MLCRYENEQYSFFILVQKVDDEPIIGDDKPCTKCHKFDHPELVSMHEIGSWISVLFPHFTCEVMSVGYEFENLSFSLHHLILQNEYLNRYFINIVLHHLS